ncbi:helix-turn-helix domain-containing protein [Acetobacter indonesiensis]|uniref:helix-turn-helix domain-containing protein n=1 Tax=Acetobacter indonesiensis TaxID=104101 RepID=UPI0039ECA8C4
MSARARDWAYSVQLPLCQKFVLVALAERASDEGVAWPSARTISDMTGACDKAVRNALKQLEQGGFIVRITSGTRSKTYQLCLDKGNEIPVSGTGQPVRHTDQPVRDTAVPDTGYPVPHTTQPVSGTGQTGMTYRQTVKNRHEPANCIAREADDWVSENWMKIGNDVLSIAGQNPASAMTPTGIVRQWLSDARKLGYSMDAARDVILQVVRQRCERGSGKGKSPAWFNVPVSEAIRTGCVSPGAQPEIVDKPIKDAYREHVNFLIKRGEKYKTYDEFAADWRERHAA